MAVKRRGGLGKGLDSLIRNKSSVPKTEETNASPENDKNNGGVSESVSEPKKEKKKENNSSIKSKKENKKDVISENEVLNGNSESESRNEKIQSTVTESEAEIVNSDKEIIKDNEVTLESDNQNMISDDEAVQDKGNSEEEAHSSVDTQDSAKGDSVLIMKISAVEPNREQPRKSFREEGIEELASSIAQYGIIQPLLVQKKDDYYEIIAGERRWRAAMKAGLREVPVIVKDYSNREAVEISLIENIQREDLNPIEEALAYDRLIQEFSMTQEQVAGRVSKSRSAVTNSLRLLKLEGQVRQMVISGELSEGHARTLLGIPNDETQRLLAERIVKEKLSVRDTEKLVKKLTSTVPKKVKQKDFQKEAILSNLSEQLKVILGTKVSITEKGKNKGKIEIEFYSDEELNRIFEMLQSLG